MNDDEMKVIISDSIPQGGGYENWKQQFKEKAMSVQTKFLRDLTSRYDLLDEAYRNARGISRQGERFFTGAANRDAALSTAEKKMKKDHEEKEGKKHKGEARSNFFTRGKVPYS